MGEPLKHEATAVAVEVLVGLPGKAPLLIGNVMVPATLVLEPDGKSLGLSVTDEDTRAAIRRSL